MLVIITMRYIVFVLTLSLSGTSFAKTTNTCSEKQFACGDGTCIPTTWECDYDIDCPDSSDEHSNCPKATCKEDQFTCGDGRMCIPMTWVCDKEIDCRDSSDENYNCSKKTCEETEFMCGDGKCIPNRWTCDHENDCVDLSDEDFDLCNKTNKECSLQEFQCGDGKCIFKSWVCDNKKDCSDASDEDPSMCNKIECIRLKEVCDEKQDCAEFEKLCANNGTIKMCNPGYKLAENEACEDINECETLGMCSQICINEIGTFRCECQTGYVIDPADWTKCKATPDDPFLILTSGKEKKTCKETEFMCGDGKCIPKRWTCDDENDCVDLSDEDFDLCNKTNKECSLQEFQCGDGKCIFKSWVCDNKKDCSDASDEDPSMCNKIECIRLKEVCDEKQDCAEFEKLCANNGTIKMCNPGYKLAENKACEDINECETLGMCSQICINEIGTFRCECQTGYVIDPADWTKCKATPDDPFLILTSRKGIFGLSLDRNNITATAIVYGANPSVALDFAFKTRTIYWSENNKIFKALINDTHSYSVLLDTKFYLTEGLAVDWIYNHVYWTNGRNKTIELVNFEGEMRKILIKDGLDKPRGIAVNPIDGWMFWTDWGNNPKIERAGMDGSYRQTIVSSEIIWPNGVTLDLIGKRIYWVDGKLNTISSCDFEGQNRKLILSSSTFWRQPFSISAFDDSIYWTNWNTLSVIKAYKYTGKSAKEVISIKEAGKLMAIQVYHRYRQPEVENYCETGNVRCSHLCLRAPQLSQNSSLTTCACPSGFIMLSDEITCVQSNETLDILQNILF